MSVIYLYKLIAVDMDGTLLNREGKLTNKTIEAISYALSKDVIFTVSTGRPIQGVRMIADLLPYDLPFITYNGAVVEMSKSHKIIYEQNLSPEIAKEIYSIGQQKNITMVVWSRGNLYYTELNDKVREYRKISGVDGILINDMTPIFEVGATKILWYDDVSNTLKYQDEMKEYFGSKVNCHTSRPMFLEFVDFKASKALAMSKIGENYGIDSSQMIAIGDGYNDLSMIKYAGLGIAMGNAPQDIKNVAKFVTLTNDEDGVAYAINKYIS